MNLTKEEHTVSVIIPIYNAEKYLKCCLDSVITQSYPYLEIICVNDGSTDKSAEIIQEYAQKDNRIVVITQPNRGLSAARNAGLDKSSGNYIMFVDADDFIEVTMVEVLLENLLTYNSDFAIESVWVYDEKNQSKAETNDAYFTLSWLNPSFNKRAFSHKELIKELFFMPVMAWSKIYDARFLKGSGVRFPEGLTYEDNPFFYELFFKAQRVSVDRRKLYNYRVNVDGSITKKSTKNYGDMLEIMRRIEKIIKAQPFYEEIKDAFLSYRIVHSLKILSSISPKFERRYFYEMQKEFLSFDISYQNEMMLSEKPFYKLYCCVRNDSYCKFKIKKMLKTLSSPER